MKKLILTVSFFSIGVVAAALMAHLAALNFQLLREYPDLSVSARTELIAAGIIALVFSLVCLGVGVLLSIKGPQHVVGVDDETLEQS